MDPRKSQSLPDNTSCSRAESVFVLIPGTWANYRLVKLLSWLSGQSKQWFEEGSTLRLRLQKAFPAATIYSFDWTGRNSATARTEATDELASYVHTIGMNHTNPRYIIIGHSHGGQIACYALRDHEEVRSSVAGVVCLSTPFLHVRLRPLTDFGTFYWFALITSILAGAIMSVTFRLFDWDPSRAGLIIYAAFPCMLFVWAFGRWLYSRSATVAYAMRLPKEVFKNLLIVKTSGDEASVVLTLCQFGTWLVHKVMMYLHLPALALDWLVFKRTLGIRIASAIIDAIAIVFCIAAIAVGIIGDTPQMESIGVPIFTGLALIMIPIIWKITATNPLWRKIGMYLWANVLLWGYVYAPWITVDVWGEQYAWPDWLFIWHGTLIQTAFLVFVLIGPLLSFVTVGLRDALAFIHLDITLEAAPPGHHTIYQFGLYGDIKTRIRASLNHSISYESDEVILAITKWVNNLDAMPRTR